jgi:hypothetical protein
MDVCIPVCINRFEVFLLLPFRNFDERSKERHRKAMLLERILISRERGKNIGLDDGIKGRMPQLICLDFSGIDETDFSFDFH